MRQIRFLMQLISISFLLVSCGDDNTNPSDNDTTTSFEATIDGDAWQAEQTQYYSITRELSGSIVDSTDITSIYTESIKIRIPDTGINVEQKTYTTNCSFLESRGTGASAKVTGWTNANGTCDVTKVTDERIEGTFSFVGTNAVDQSTKTITGTFNVPKNISYTFGR